MRCLEMAVQEWGGICIYRGILTLTPLPFPILFTDHNSWSRWVVFLLKRQRERERERERERQKERERGVLCKDVQNDYSENRSG